MAKKPTHGGPRKGAGRPSKTGEPRNIPIPVKISDSELGALRLRAVREGVTLAALVRAALGFTD